MLWEAIKVREFYMIIIFVLVSGVLVPDFAAYDFYFYTDELHMSNSSYSMLSVVMYIGIILGARIYRGLLEDLEVRSLKIAFSLLFLIVQGLRVVLAFRKTESWFGMPEWYVVVLTVLLTNILLCCCDYVPMAVIFAKVIPVNIEATCFALYVSVQNLR